MTTLLREARLAAPGPQVGRLVEALWKAGLFRLRACLFGAVAYQTFGTVLGYRLGSTAMQTGDVDIAQFYAISSEVGDSIASILSILRTVDPTFEPIPQFDETEPPSRFRTSGGLRVDILKANTGSDELARTPARMPALGGASAQSLRFLDYLIHEPVRTVMLYGGGVPVLVPQPQRFAVHKMIVASRRLSDGAKADKDLLQANNLAEALLEVGRRQELEEAWQLARDRGAHWREALDRSLRRMSETGLTSMAQVVG